MKGNCYLIKKGSLFFIFTKAALVTNKPLGNKHFILSNNAAIYIAIRLYFTLIIMSNNYMFKFHENSYTNCLFLC